MIYIKNINEWLDSPGSVEVPGQNAEIKVNSRNYVSMNQPFSYVEDTLLDISYFHQFLDEESDSENFNNFLRKKKRSTKEITRYLKKSLENKRNYKK